ncbi:MAG: 1-acyl-sn-glycerol-3-phosphate acyltransferase, partial [Saprospiraceae bacterium]
MIAYLRAVFRLIFFSAGAMFYVSRYLVKTIFTGPNLDRGIRLRKEYIQIFFPVLGITVKVAGDIPTTGGLLVCNHRSYVDPFLLLKDTPALPVGKAAVAHWPVIGIAARTSGAIFVDRKSPESRKKAREDITNAIAGGYFIINFAEGTTHKNGQTTAFKPGMFRDAAIAGFPIYPVALEYQRTSDFWVGDDTFIRHFLQCFGKRKTFAKVHYGKAIRGNDPEQLMAATKKQLDLSLLEIR